MQSLEFKLDRSVFGRLQVHAPRFADLQVFTGGYMTVNDTNSYPYLLTDNAGNMTLTWFMPLEGNPMGEVKSMTVSIGCSRAKRADILFLGGGAGPREASAAYRRATPPAEKGE